MEIKKLIFLFSLFILFQACSSKKFEMQTDNSKFRSPAAETSPYQQCIQQKKNTCSATFPYDQLKKKWWQFEFQYLDQKNELHKKYNQCYSRGSIQCARKFDLFELSQKLEKISSSVDIAKTIADLKDQSIWDDVTIPIIHLASNAIKEIWIHILAFKKIFDEILVKHKVKENMYEILHGKGVSIAGLAYAGAGIGIQHEAIVHNGDIALFCAPGVMVKTDVGVGLEFSAIQTLGCKDHADYRGKFFTVDFGGSAEAFGLPLSAGISYSLGIDVSNFLKVLADKTTSGEFSIKNLIKELLDISQSNSNIDEQSQMAQLYIAYLLSQALNEEQLSTELNDRIEYSNKKFNVLAPRRALSYYIKNYLNSILKENPDYIQSMPNFFFALFELNRNLSECDAVSGSVGLSLSLSPVSVGLSLHQYTQVTTIRIDDILYLASFTPKMLMNLNLPPQELSKFKAALKRIMRIIPDIAFNKCLENAGSKFYRDGKNLLKIMRGKKE